MKMKNFLSESFFRESVYILKWKLLKTRTDEKIICPFLGNGVACRLWGNIIDPKARKRRCLEISSFGQRLFYGEVERSRRGDSLSFA